MAGWRGMKSVLRQIFNHPRPIRAITRKMIEKCSLFSYQNRLDICAVERPHYGRCIFEATKLAARLDIPKISVIEFGCGGGNGILNAEMHIVEVSKLFAVEIELYGFDSGQGLPPLQDYRDFPYYFKPGQYQMDPNRLLQKLKFGKLVIGDVKESCKTFFADFGPAPIGCIFHDLDYYSSTIDAFTLFEADPEHFLPRVFLYFDDIIGNNTWLPSEFAGELLAIKEFNRRYSVKKIARNRAIRMEYPDQRWAHQIYIYHDFNHPKYNIFVADHEQAAHEGEIRLRS
jgi:hypothetical protein